MIDGTHVAVAGLIAVLAAIFGLLKKTKQNKQLKSKGPPKNIVFVEALEGIESELNEEVDRIKSATDGDSPADDLADLGNARRR
jgi:lipid A disaccharide synthetase